MTLKLALFMPILCMVGCASAKLPPLPTPGPDLCLAYSPFEYSKKAAWVELIDTLRKHNSNELGFYDKCVAGKQSQNPGGAR